MSCSTIIHPPIHPPFIPLATHTLILLGVCEAPLAGLPYLGEGSGFFGMVPMPQRIGGPVCGGLGYACALCGPEKNQVGGSK